MPDLTPQGQAPRPRPSVDLRRCRRLVLPLLLLSMMLPSTTQAQDGNARIEGVVRDARTLQPLPAANVFLSSLNRGTFTDREGTYRLTALPSRQDRFVVSYMGYQRHEESVTLAPGETRRIDVLLVPHSLAVRDIVVTASRRAESEFRAQQPVTVTGPDQIARRSSSSTADALRETPGVMIQKTTAGHGTPVIRGQIGKDVLLLFNGVRLNRPTFRPGGNQYLNTIDAESLRRIEVVRGPGSVMYGSDAQGGMVNLVARPPEFSSTFFLRPRLQMRYTGADRGRSLHVGVEGAGPAAAVQAGLTARRTGDLVPGRPLSTQHPTGYQEWGGHLLGTVAWGPQRTFRLDLLKVRQYEVPRYDQYASGAFQRWLYEPQDRLLASATYQHRQPIPWITGLEWNLSWHREQEGRRQQRTDSDRLTVDDDRLITLGTFVQATSIIHRRHVLQYGVEMYHDRLATRRQVSTPDTSWSARGSYPDGASYSSFGTWVGDDIELNGNTNLSVGLRQSWIRLEADLEAPFGPWDQTFRDLTGNLGLTRQLRPWLNVVASVARGFRAPNFNDTLVLQTTHANMDAPSPGLRPEASTQYEVGIKIEHERRDLEAFLYRTRLTDLIVRVPGTYYHPDSELDLPFFDENGNGVWDPGEPEIRVKRNAARAEITGAEIQGHAWIFEEWRVRGNGFVTRGQNQTDREPMRRIPPLMGMAALAWRPAPATEVEVIARGAAAQRRLSTEDNEDPRIDQGGTAGWTDWSLRAARALGPVRVDLVLGNLFDRAYREHGSGVHSPGRHLVLTLTWDGQTPFPSR